MLLNYTAKHTRIDSGYMGQLIEWTEVITEGKDIEECRTLYSHLSPLSTLHNP